MSSLPTWKRSVGAAALAFALTLAAVAVPCVSWYVVGSREAEREAARLEAAVRELIRQTGERLAVGLARRLEALREAESRRPFYHYQNLYHDPQTVSQGASVLPSPLAQGPADPLIRAHFQIRSNGRLTLPTLNEEGLKTGVEGEAGAQREIQRRLQPAVPALLAAAGRGQASGAAASAGPKAASEQPVTVQKLKPDGWIQNATVNQLYTQLQQSGPRPVLPAPLRGVGKRQADVLVRVGAFAWHTVALAGGEELAALREVQTPDGPLVQGFLVFPMEVSAMLSGSPMPAQFLPGPIRGQGEFGVPLESVSWRVSVESAARLSAAQAQAQAVRLGFRRMFGSAMLAVLLAAIAILVVVAQSERLARERSELAAVAAHELRTPLAGRRMYGEMLAEGLGDPARSRDYAGRIAAEAERLGRVVSTLIGFTRLERKTLSVRPEPGDLGKAVRISVERQRPALEAAGIRVETAIADDLPPVAFDRDAVSQILLNLLDNVEKHTRSSEKRSVRIGVARAPSGVAISVADNGPGLPADVRPRAFRPYPGTKGRSGGGLGLGLALARALARAHGGELAAANAPGGGALVTVLLPALSTL